MTNVTDLMSNVYDFLSTQFATSISGNTFLQIGWPGVSLSPADFKAFDTPNGPYDPQRAEETVSSLVNIEPACNALRFENTGCEIDDLYQIVIEDAIPPDGGATLFNDAKYVFNGARKGSQWDPSLFYYPCKVNPSDWYTEDSARGWSTIALSTNQVKPAVSSSPFIRFGGRTLVNAGVLRIPPPVTNPTVLAAGLKTVVNSKMSNFQLRIPVVRNIGSTFAAGTVQPSTGGVGARPVPPRVVPGAKAGLTPKFVVSRFGTKALPVVDAKKFDVVPTRNLTFNQHLFLRNILQEQLIPKPVENKTEGFSISFKYCLVNIVRSWLNLALLSSRNWYMGGTEAGYYSQGMIDNNPGLFTMIPNAFIAIRDLKITANWSANDSAAARTSSPATESSITN